jgi:uncharacterized protein (TIGR02284 family)
VLSVVREAVALVQWNPFKRVAMRLFKIDVKSAVTSCDEHAILAECEREEDVVKKNYRDALNKELSADVRAVIGRQYQGIVLNHDRICNLHDRYAAANS